MEHTSKPPELSNERERLESRLEMMVRELDSINTEFIELSKVLSHDFRAPLRGISSLAEWILEDHEEELSEDLKEKITLIYERTLKLNELLDAVIEYLRSIQITRENTAVNIEAVVNEAVDLAGLPEHIDLQISGRWPVLFVDEGKFIQIFKLLILNAVKCIEKSSGQINITSEFDESDWLFIIKDDGTGIRETKKEKIFELFETSISNSG